MLSHMTYDDALTYVKGQVLPEEISCLRSKTFYHDYRYNEGDSIVSQVFDEGRNWILI